MRTEATEEELASAMASPTVPSVLYSCGFEPVDFYVGVCMCVCM